MREKLSIARNGHGEGVSDFHNIIAHLLLRIRFDPVALKLMQFTDPNDRETCSRPIVLPFFMPCLVSFLICRDLILGAMDIRRSLERKSVC